MRGENKQKIIWLLVLLCLISSVSAIDNLMALQGTASDAIGGISNGNLIVTLWDQPSGGALLYNSSNEFNGAIQNGRYDVLLGENAPLSLEYGHYYYLGLNINGQDMNFNGSARRLFQSNIGTIGGQYIEAGAINSSQIADSSITDEDIALSSIDKSRIRSNGTWQESEIPNLTSSWPNTINASRIISQSLLNVNNSQYLGGFSAQDFFSNDSSLASALSQKLDASDQRYNDTLSIQGVNSTANAKAQPTTCTGNNAVQTTSSSGSGTCVAFGTGTSNSTLLWVANGTGLIGGNITTGGSLSLATSGVTSGTYGNATMVPVCTYDTYGRATSCTNTSISFPAGNAYTADNNTLTLAGTQFSLNTTYMNQSWGNSSYVSRNSWVSIDNYPSACGAGTAVTQIGDTLTCSGVNATGNTYTADNASLTLTGTQFTANQTWINWTTNNSINQIANANYLAKNSSSYNQINVSINNVTGFWDQNNYTNSIGFSLSGTTETLNLNRTGLANITASFNDQNNYTGALSLSTSAGNITINENRTGMSNLTYNLNLTNQILSNIANISGYYDQNNYTATLSFGVSGTTVTLNENRTGLANITAAFNDQNNYTAATSLSTSSGNITLNTNITGMSNLTANLNLTNQINLVSNNITDLNTSVNGSIDIRANEYYLASNSSSNNQITLVSNNVTDLNSTINDSIDIRANAYYLAANRSSNNQITLVSENITPGTFSGAITSMYGFPGSLNVSNTTTLVGDTIFDGGSMVYNVTTNSLGGTFSVNTTGTLTADIYTSNIAVNGTLYDGTNKGSARTAGTTFFVGTLRCNAFPVTKGFTTDGIGWIVGVANLSSATKIAFYNDTGNGYPGTLLFNTSSVPVSGTGVLLNSAFGTYKFTDNTRYWACYAANASTNARVNVIPLADVNSLGISSSTTPNLGYTVAYTYTNALPSTYTAGATFTVALGNLAVYARVRTDI